MRNKLCKWALAGAIASSAATTLLAQPSGQWDFEDGDLTATVGDDLSYYDGPGGATEAATSFNSTTGFSIPNIGGAPADVMKVGANPPGTGFNLPAPAAANGGGSYVNDYTLVLDVLFPTESDAKPRAILETDGGLFNPDAEFFVNANNGLGVKEQAFGTVSPNTWHRLGIVADATEGAFDGQLRFYIDGNEVGVRNVANFLDDRFALSPGGFAQLFTDDNDEVGVAYVNSIQIRDVALSRGQMRALGGASATGIPETIPPVPSGIEQWIPPGEFASRDTALGAIIALGDTTIQDSSISLKLNGTVQASPTITRADGLITVKTGAQDLTPGTVYTNEISYTDSLGGAQTFSKVFTAALFFEDFEGLVLGPNVDEGLAGQAVWTNQPPTGWTVIRTNMAGFDSPDDDGDGWPDADGVTEWSGWGFANKDWWVQTAGDQDRSQFTLSSGNAAIADPDEWDDAAHAQGLFNTSMRTAPISLVGVAPNSAFLRFASSWRPEARDDGPPNFPEGNINNQTAIVSVSYDGGTPVQIMKWDSVADSPTFHTDSQNESVLLQLNNPAGAQNMVLSFDLVEAANDWWWAVDNIVVNSGAAAPTITKHPASLLSSAGGTVSFSVEATGTEPFNYQWQLDGENIPGATSATLTISDAQTDDAGAYTVIVSNAGGSVTSSPAILEIFSGEITQDLVAHLKFDSNLDDSSGRENNGSPVGSPTFQAGKIGQAVHIPSGADYVTLGVPADLNFGTATDFTIAFWAQVIAATGDPSFIANKDWGSGGNQGYVFSTETDGRIQWNIAGAPGGRKDFDSPGGIFNNPNWHHIAVTFDRTGNASTFVDGALVDVRSISADQNNLDTPDGLATNIGQDGTGAYGSVFTDANIDDVGIWRRVLTGQEVLAIFTAAQEGKDLSQAEVQGAVPPQITTQPASVTVATGNRATFTVAASGTTPLTYQWQRNGTDIAGATEATLTVMDVSAANAGNYTVVVTGPGGTVTSQAAVLTAGPAPVSEVTGQWDFDAGDLTATVGAPLEYFGDIESVTTFSESQIGGQTAEVMNFPAATAAQGYIMTHGAAANGGGTKVNQYTLIMDLMFPAESNSSWRGLFQVTPENTDDGELFVNEANGIGISGNYTGQIVAETWHRVAFVFDLPGTTLYKYIDGVLVGSQTIEGVDGRFSLAPTALLLTDNDDETAAGFVNSIQFRSGLMSEAQIAALGGATADGIPAGEVSGPTVSISRSGNNITITVNGTGNFQLQKKESLSDTEWVNEGAPSATGTFTVTADDPAAFFRVQQL